MITQEYLNEIIEDYENELEKWQKAALQLIKSHDKGDLNGEAEGWIELRKMLKNV